MQPLKIVFAGTPAFAARHLEAILESPHNVIAVYTQPDRQSGRGKKLLASPVKKLALDHSLPVFQPQSLRGDIARHELDELHADLMVVVAYGLILPESILQTPALGCINVHASLLPRWRGAAPIERALLAGDEQTGVTIMQMDAGLDTGDMLYKKSVEITESDTRITLEEKLATAGAESLLHVLDNFGELNKRPESQDDTLSTYASKVSKDEALVKWGCDARDIARQIRAGIGRYPAYCFLSGQRIRLLEATPCEKTLSGLPGTIVSSSKNDFTVNCGTGAIRIVRVQLPGKNPVYVKDVFNANPTYFAAGIHFTETEVGN